jgi:hypothetical protein
MRRVVRPFQRPFRVAARRYALAKAAEISPLKRQSGFSAIDASILMLATKWPHELGDFGAD